MPLALACKSLTSRDLLITRRHPQGFHHLMDTQLNFQSITRRTELETWTLAQADIVMDVHRFYLAAVVSDAGFILSMPCALGMFNFQMTRWKKCPQVIWCIPVPKRSSMTWSQWKNEQLVLAQSSMSCVTQHQHGLQFVKWTLQVFAKPNELVFVY